MSKFVEIGLGFPMCFCDGCACCIACAMINCGSAMLLARVDVSCMFQVGHQPTKDFKSLNGMLAKVLESGPQQLR